MARKVMKNLNPDFPQPSLEQHSKPVKNLNLKGLGKPFRLWENPSGPEGFGETLQALKGLGKPFRP